jgi:hypothetical protein
MAEEKLIPKVYEPHQVEEKWYSYWMENNYFHAEPDQGGDPFCIVIPPSVCFCLVDTNHQRLTTNHHSG